MRRSGRQPGHRRSALWSARKSMVGLMVRPRFNSGPPWDDYPTAHPLEIQPPRDDQLPLGYRSGRAWLGAAPPVEEPPALVHNRQDADLAWAKRRHGPVPGLHAGLRCRVRACVRLRRAACGLACRPACGYPEPCADLRADLREPRADLRAACAGRILRPPPPSVPFGSALSRMKDFGERNETRGGS